MKSYVTNVGHELITQLRGCSDHIFQQKCGEILETAFSDVTMTMPRTLLDKSGIDFCVFAKGADSFDTVFQCKGFEVADLTTTQVQQCLKSIDSFKNSQFRVKEYFLIVNRIVKGENRKRLENAVDALVRQGVAERAEVLDLEAFLELLFKKAEREVESLLMASAGRYSDQHHNRMQEEVYVPDAPFVEVESSDKKTNPLRFLRERVISLALQSHNNKRSWTFIVGEFGFGKTSLALQIPNLLEGTGLLYVYFPVAQFPPSAFNGDVEFLWTMLELIREDGVSRTNKKDRIQHAILKELLKREKRILLIFDGLDEHPICWRERGLAAIFGIFKTFNATCVFTVREELIAERHGYFQDALKGSPGAFMLTLCQWDERLILDYAARWKVLKGFVAEPKLEHFERAVETGQYEQFYGDIPKRPLFLKMLLVDVVKEDIRRRNLAEIYTGYLIDKFRIDRETSAMRPAVGRPLNSNEDYTKLCALFFDILTLVASRMYDIVNGEVQMSRELDEGTLRECIAIGTQGDALDLPSFLSNSVLVPSRRRSSKVPDLSIVFAHKSFQSFFLAKYVLKVIVKRAHDPQLLEATLPGPVIIFVRGLFDLEPDNVRANAKQTLDQILQDSSRSIRVAE